ncbi:hypothetical protein OBBRIDRAFT_837593 [Obba rivulosa]|uniref:Uncharacterized protein n=1 Tax=Obba rivulosa TaxID=1052685 RepID=A0A8E2AM62_9APHY|nr:hypothetical protein OBBRIDRAFT_837593 [Obba rivulosa]
MEPHRDPLLADLAPFKLNHLNMSESKSVLSLKIETTTVRSWGEARKVLDTVVEEFHVDHAFREALCFKSTSQHAESFLPFNTVASRPSSPSNSDSSASSVTSMPPLSRVYWTECSLCGVVTNHYVPKTNIRIIATPSLGKVANAYLQMHGYDLQMTMLITWAGKTSRDLKEFLARLHLLTVPTLELKFIWFIIDFKPEMTDVKCLIK